MLGEAKICIIVPDGQELSVCCVTCAKIHGKVVNKFLVGLVIKEDGQAFHYIVGERGPECCGEAITVPRTFDTDGEAEKSQKEIQEHLNLHGSTEGLLLLSVASKSH
ncbi:MAG: hypothetical protein MRY49_00120 [Candidatus Pacebacteria bacterium]|nr:hypothetical protein [Candidatus Paceibacterota bacterium]